MPQESCDADDDSDGVLDADDICPRFPTPPHPLDPGVDSDSAGVPVLCDPCLFDVGADDEQDWLCEIDDNCPELPMTIIHKHELKLSFVGFVKIALPFAILQILLATVYVLVFLR